MSWDNPISPIDAKNSIGVFLCHFLGVILDGGYPGLLGDCVYRITFQSETRATKIEFSQLVLTYSLSLTLLYAKTTSLMEWT